MAMTATSASLAPSRDAMAASYAAMTVGSWAEGSGERSTAGEEDEVGGCTPTPVSLRVEGANEGFIQGERA